MIWIAIGIGAILLFTVLYREIEKFRELNQQICHLIHQIISVVSAFLVGVIKQIFHWVSSEGVEPPKKVFIGIVGLAIGVGVAYADWHVVRQTLPVVFPFEMSGALLAIVIVGLTGVWGACFRNLLTLFMDGRMEDWKSALPSFHPSILPKCQLIFEEI